MGKAVSGELSCTMTCLLLIPYSDLGIDRLENSTIVMCCSTQFSLILYPLSDKVCKGYIVFSFHPFVISWFVCLLFCPSVCLSTLCQNFVLNI